MAEFAEPEALLQGARKAYERGYRKMDAYTPFPIEGLAEAVGRHHSRVPLIVLIGALLGAVGGFFLQYWAAAVAYPLNVGGRPLNSWPSFIPITFELTVLVAALFAVLGMLAVNGLPKPYHPVFNTPGFELASRNRFFLCIESSDLRFDPAATSHFLESLGPVNVVEVEP
jgi:hypothetical protein